MQLTWNLFIEDSDDCWLFFCIPRWVCDYGPKDHPAVLKIAPFLAYVWVLMNFGLTTNPSLLCFPVVIPAGNASTWRFGCGPKIVQRGWQWGWILGYSYEAYSCNLNLDLANSSNHKGPLTKWKGASCSRISLYTYLYICIHIQYMIYNTIPGWYAWNGKMLTSKNQSNHQCNTTKLQLVMPNFASRWWCWSSYSRLRNCWSFTSKVPWFYGKTRARAELKCPCFFWGGYTFM